jgi:hypothetical protein
VPVRVRRQVQHGRRSIERSDALTDIVLRLRGGGYLLAGRTSFEVRFPDAAEVASLSLS